MGDLSPHFSRAEFACHHCGQQVPIDPQLLHVLEHIRAGTGDPLVVVSGYRCPVRNREVGGAKDSQHMLGTAADIPRGRATLTEAVAAGARGVGVRAGWAIHVDTRLGPKADWLYPGA